MSRNYTWGLVICPWFSKGGRGGESIWIFKAREKKKRGKKINTSGRGCKQFAVHSEDNAHFPISSSHPISSLFLCHPALPSLGPLTPPSVIKRSVIRAQCGSLPTPAGCEQLAAADGLVGGRIDRQGFRTQSRGDRQRL